jgi:hypothetical protein
VRHSRYTIVTSKQHQDDTRLNLLGHGISIIVSEFCNESLGIPGQTGESVTDVDLTPSPCSTQNDITCTGFSDIAIPGIGEGHLLVILHNHKVQGTEHFVLQATILFIIAVGLALEPSFKTISTIIGDMTFVPITIPDIGTGQVTIQLL